MAEESRAATLEDLPEILRLVREGRTSIADARGGALWLERQAPEEPIGETYTEAIESDSSLVQLSTIDDVPLGIMLVELEHKGGRDLAVAREIYVTPEARGIGLGELMMDAATDWSRSMGCVGMDGYALPGDRATKNFYETFGLVARGIVVHRDLR